MSDTKEFDQRVEQEVDRKLEGLAGVLNRQIEDQYIKKGWEQDWITAKSLGGSSDVTKPAQQSYLVHKCVTVISNNFPQAPFVIYGPNDKPIPFTSPLYQLFERPNDTMSGFDLWSSTSSFYTLYGEAFWYLVQSIGQATGSSKLPAEILVLDPRLMKEVVNPADSKLLGWIYNGVSLNKEEVLQFKNTNPYNPYRGLPPLDAVNVEIRSDYKASIHQTKFFDNNAIPGMILKVDKEDTSTLPELKKLVRMWEQGHKGVDKAHKVGILRGGMSYDVIGLSQKEMDFVNSRNFTRDIVLSVFGVPKSLAGFTEGINRATADTQKRIFWTETIKPQMLRMQERINATLLRNIDAAIYGKFDLTKVDELRQGYEEEVKAADILFRMGFSKNELNDRFDLGFDEDTQGNEKYISSSLVSITTPPESNDSDSKSNDSAPKTTDLDEILKIKQKDIEKTIHGKIKKFLINQRVKVLKDLDANRIQYVFRQDDENIVKIFTPVFRDAMQIIGDTISTYKQVGSYSIDKSILYEKVNLVVKLNKKVLNQILGVLDSEDKISKVKDIYKYTDTHSIVVAKNETIDLTNQVFAKVYSKNGLNLTEIVRI